MESPMTHRGNLSQMRMLLKNLEYFQTFFTNYTLPILSILPALTT